MITDFDMLACAISSEGPDIGKGETVYDLSGAGRFSQNAEGRDKGYYSYAKYDEIGRLIEDGILEGIWDREQLRDYAKNDPSWPTTSSTWGRKLTYDGDGSNPYLMSRLISVVVHGDLESQEASNQQTFDYNISGNIIKQTLEIFKDNASYSTFYNYNNKGNLIQVIYPYATNEASPSEYTYTYNQGGVLQSIYSPTNNTEYASYIYNADGSLQTETLVNSLPAKVERTYQYISPGWVKKIADSYYIQEMYYTKDGNGNPGYYTGLIVEEQFNILKTAPSTITPSYSYRYTYDCLGRLITAENKTNEQVNSQWSIGLNNEPITYDSNGNFLQLKKGDIQKDYTYNPGTDEVKNTTGDQNEGYAYNLIGATTAAEEKGISSILYNRASGKETLITTVSDEIRFEYNSNNQRILKSSTALSKLYLHGLNASPLIEKIKQELLPEYAVLYVYGNNGLIGFIRDNMFYLVLSDRQGSNRILLNQDGIIEAAYTYLPFGGFMDEPDDLKKLMSYFYTSQEWDEETKLYNYKARFYDPEAGRFFSTDAAGESASPYIYCINNPIMFTDFSGNHLSGTKEAWITIGLGVGAVGLGIVITIFTAGAAAPIAVTGALAAGALVGAGASSTIYSSTHTNNWNAKDWAVATTIGGVSGAAGGGLGMAWGATASAAASCVENLALKSVISIGVGIVSGAAGDSTVNVLGTLAYNGISGAPLESGLGVAAIGGLIGGSIGGGLGGLGGFFKGLRGLDAESKELFEEMPLFNAAEDRARAGIAGAPRHEGGAVGIWNKRSGEINLGRHTEPILNPETATIEERAFGPSHAQLARDQYGVTETIRNTDAGPRATYPNLKGFNIRKTGPNSIDIGFNSLTLNGYEHGERALLNSSAQRMQILSGLRSAGIRVSGFLNRGMERSASETFFSLFLKTPLP
ncbi:MAG: RHS repeat-associated core domain-containing protein [Alphaproteobacteria bacterium]|nr:RHS repeat-associated core domain-containing protein [Alphaproteobacteria bacterium]